MAETRAKMVRTLAMGIVATGLSMTALGSEQPARADGGNTVEVIEAGHDGGRFSSMVLDDDDHPVVAFIDEVTFDVQVVHCDDPACSGDEPAAVIDVGVAVDDFYVEKPSLTLDAAGNPVVFYFDSLDNHMTLVHCNDSACVGGDESIEPIALPDGTTGSKWDLSMALDPAGNPYLVRSGRPGPSVISCNDPNCAGDDEDQRAIRDGDATRVDVVFGTDGNPTIAYLNRSDGLFLGPAVLRCNDLMCSGDDEQPYRVGRGFSIWHDAKKPRLNLVLDAHQKPAMAYLTDAYRGELVVVRCRDASCSQGATTGVAAVPTSADSLDGSLAIDANDHPVVALPSTNGVLIVRCDDPACDGPTEPYARPDTSVRLAREPSVALDADGNPVVVYGSAPSAYRVGVPTMKLVRCADPTCRGALVDAALITPIADQFSDPGSSVELTASAVDPNGDTITFSATGLPDGVSIDTATGEITGVIGTSPDFEAILHDVTVSATDVDGTTSTSFVWKVDAAFFSCRTSGSRLEWSDISALTYTVRHRLDGADSFVKTTTGRSIEAPSQSGTYEVIARGRPSGSFEDWFRVVRTTCPAGGAPEPTDFSCTVDAGDVTWSDVSDQAYRLRYSSEHDGSSTRYLGTTTTTTFPARAAYGTYTVITNVDGQRVSTSCEAPSGAAPPPFTCFIEGDTLQWSDQGVGRYFLRRINDGVETYVGSVSGERTFAVDDVNDQYVVVAYIERLRLTTICEPYS